jgi:hypothetical protein
MMFNFNTTTMTGEITMDFRAIDIDTYKGRIPSGYDLVVVEKSHVEEGGDFDATTLYGFDEVGEFEDGLIEPQYGFLKITFH